MAIRISNGIRDKVVSRLPSLGTGDNSVLLLYAGARPTNVSTSVDGFIAYGRLTKGAKAVGSQAYSVSIKAIAAGTLSWGKIIVDPGPTSEPHPNAVSFYEKLSDFTVGLTGSGATLIVSKAAINAGDVITATINFNWPTS